MVLIKPDGLVRSLTGNILTRLSETKLDIVAAKVCRVSKKMAEEHYCHLKDKPFYEELVQYLQQDPARSERPLTLGEVLWSRIDQLPEAAKRST